MFAVEALAARTLSDPTTDPTTGADLGAGPGAGRTSEGDMGGAQDIMEAAKMAKAMTVKP
jgi:Mn-containing catalase